MQDDLTIALDFSDFHSGVKLQVASPSSNVFCFVPPSLRLAGTPGPALWWSESGSIASVLKSRPRRNVDGLLLKFVKLHNASDAQILKFAQRWGVLSIWPTWHTSELPSECGGEDEQTGGWYRETTAFWRKAAAHFRAILEMGAMLQVNKPAPYETLLQVFYLDAFKQPWQEIPTHAFDKKWMEFAQLPQFSDDTPLREITIKLLLSGAFSDQEIQKHALVAAVSRWTEHTPIYLNMVPSLGGFVAQPVLSQRQKSLQDEQDTARSIMSAVYKPEYQKEGYNDHLQKIDLRADDFSSGGMYPMRPSILRNVLVMQMVALLGSTLGICAVCGNAYQPEKQQRRQRTDRAAICGADCRKKRDAARKKAAYATRKHAV